jgi:hypothetical protein
MSEYRKYILIGFIIGFAFFTIMNRGEKMKPLFFNSIIINIMNNTYHIHHWIIFLIVFLILLYILTMKITNYTNCKALILGICLGSILQGLSYSDAFDIRIK